MSTDPTDSRDTLFANPQQRVEPFRFDSRVADVFPDMIARSVPGYGLVLEQIGVMARRFVQNDTAIYDLGCSLGAATLAIRHNIPADVEHCRIVAVDSSPAMVERCRRNIARDPSRIGVEVIEADISKLDFEPASLVVMNYTLQFVAPERRRALLTAIAKALKPGGALVLSEKLTEDDPRRDQLLDALHLDFKRANGYSDLEIAGKRASLDNVLVRDTWAVHRERMLSAGFRQASIWFRCYNFASMLAVR